MSTIEWVAANRGFVSTRVSRYTAVGIVCALAMLLVFATLLALVAWLFGVLANFVLGTQNATLMVAGWLAGAAAFSRCTGRSFADLLIMSAFGGFTIFVAALYGVAGCALIFGG